MFVFLQLGSFQWQWCSNTCE